MNDFRPTVNLDVPKRPEIVVNLLGAFSLSVNGRVAARIPKSCEQLFALVLMAREEGIHRDKAAERIWPDAPPSTSRFYLRRTLMRCREALAECREHLESLGNDVIRMVPRHVNSDFWELEKLSDSDTPIELLAAFELGQREFLPGSKSEWVAGERMRALLRTQTACLKCAQLLRQVGDFSGALSVLVKGHQLDPLDESVLLPFWECLVETGQEKQFRSSYIRTLKRYAKSGIEMTPTLADAARRMIRLIDQPGSSNLVDPERGSDNRGEGSTEAFFGRQNELKQIIALIKTHRMVEISGAPGIGKTRLAIEVCAALGWPWSNVEAADLPAQTLAPSRRSLLVVEAGQQLKTELLENLEGLLESHPYLRIFVLSRFPDRTTPLSRFSLGPLSEGDATQLFCNLIGGLDSNCEEIRTLLARLDGNPAAIRLAADFSSRFGVFDTIQRLDRRDLQDPLRSAIVDRVHLAWLEGMDIHQTESLAMLTVVPGRLSLPLARAVTSASLDCTFDDFVSGVLIRRSLATATPDGTVRLSPLIRVGARVSAELSAAASRRAAEYFMKCALTTGSAPAEDLEAIEFAISGGCDDRISLIDLLNWAGPTLIELREPQRLREITCKVLSSASDPPSATIQAWLNLGSAYHIAHDLVNAKDAFAHAYEDALRLGDSHKITDCLVSIGEVAANAGELELAANAQNKALEIAATRGDTANEARALRNLGYVNRMRREYDASIENTTKALALHTLLGDRDGRAWCIGSLASCLIETGQFIDARIRLLEALDIHRVNGNTPGVMWNLTSLADVCNKLGDYQSATKYATEALKLQEGNRSHTRAWPLRILADSAILQADYRLAEELLLEVLVALRASGDSMSEAITLIRLAEASVGRGDPIQGKAYLDLAKSIATRIDHPGLLHSVQVVAEQIP